MFLVLKKYSYGADNVVDIFGPFFKEELESAAIDIILRFNSSLTKEDVLGSMKVQAFGQFSGRNSLTFSTNHSWEAGARYVLETSTGYGEVKELDNKDNPTSEWWPNLKATRQAIKQEEETAKRMAEEAADLELEKAQSML